MNKIEKTWSYEEGLKHYKLATFDYSSLEARRAAQDTFMNDEGMDKNLYELYKKDSPLGSDMHSYTAWTTFCKSIDMKIHEATDENGKTWLFVDTQKMKISRNVKCKDKNGKDIIENKQLEVLGNEIKETDEILDYIE